MAAFDSALSILNKLLDFLSSKTGKAQAVPALAPADITKTRLVIPVEKMGTTVASKPAANTPVTKPVVLTNVVVNNPVVVAPKHALTPPWMILAKSLMGTKETPGSGNTKAILEWAKEMGLNKVYTADSIPWCGLFTGYCIFKTGFKGVKTPLWALSWLGAPMVALKEPCFGAIMCFGRNGGGHVGFYVSEDSDYYHILGGNQSDMVNVTKVAKSRCQGYRWPSNAEQYRTPGRIKAAFSGKVSINEA